MSAPPVAEEWTDEDMIKEIEGGCAPDFVTGWMKRRDPSTWGRTISSRGETFLHFLIETGNVKLVGDLVDVMHKEDMVRTDSGGNQPLVSAATIGIKNIAEIILRKDNSLANITNSNGLLPVIIALKNGNNDMAEYLYKITDKTCIDPENPENGDNGARLVVAAILSEMYGLAGEALKIFPELAFKCDDRGRNALCVLAEKPSAFRSGCHFGIMDALLYRVIRVPLPETLRKETSRCNNNGQRRNLSMFKQKISSFGNLKSYQNIWSSVRGM